MVVMEKFWKKLLASKWCTSEYGMAAAGEAMARARAPRTSEGMINVSSAALTKTFEGFRKNGSDRQ